MKIFLALVLLLNSLAGFSTEPQCETPGELMASKIAGKEFTKICNHFLANDEGCKKLKPEKRMNCESKNANNILSNKELASKIGQCVKGFLWDSMADLVKFIAQVIKVVVGAGVNSAAGIIKFLGDSEYRNAAIAAAEKTANSGWKLGKAFLNSASLYFAREFPKNLKEHPFNPLLALGKTLMDPLVNFMSEAIQEIAAEYIPQFKCMNGTAKLYTVCRTLGDFIMPPAFLFAYIKYGVPGLKALINKAKDGSKEIIAKTRQKFSEANEIQKASKIKDKTEKIALSHITIDNLPNSAAKRSSKVKTAKKTESAAKLHPLEPSSPAPLTKPIEEHTGDELIEIARSERRADVPKADVTPATKNAAPETKKLTVQEQMDQLAIDSKVEDMITGTKDLPDLMLKYSKDPEYSALLNAPKMYPQQGRDIALVIQDMEKTNPQMKKSEIRQEVERLLNTCELKR